MSLSSSTGDAATSATVTTAVSLLPSTLSTPTSLVLSGTGTSSFGSLLRPNVQTTPLSVPPLPAINTSSEVSAFSIKIPPFWPGDPELWFAQVEAQFRTRGIVSELTKFSHVVSSLDRQYASEVRDILLTPPASQPFTALREALIRRTSDSESSKLQQLLSTARLGDQKPSQLLRRMQRLVQGKTLDDTVFRQLFLQRLPNNIVMVLEATATHMPLEKQAEVADTLMELYLQGPDPPSGHVAAVSCPARSTTGTSATSSDDVQSLKAEVSALRQAIQDLGAGKSSK